MSYPYSNVVLGGTFDLLHLGHQFMLNKAFEYGRLVTIGLTSDQFNKTRGKESFQDQNTRLTNLKEFLKQKNYLQRSKITLINNIYGTTLIDLTLEAIVVTKENKHTVEQINQKRIRENFNPLQTILVSHLKDEEGKILSSSRIRDGLIDPLGRSYKKLLLKIAGKRLTESIRTKLKKPLGRIVAVNTIHRANNHIITVGDVTTANFLKHKIQPSLAIIDAKVARKQIDSKINHSLKANNPPGQISKALILAIDQALKKLQVPSSKFQVLSISGEEDLATIPAILLSPLGTRVYYGQPNQGLVEVKVDLEIKDYLCKLLKDSEHLKKVGLFLTL